MTGISTTSIFAPLLSKPLARFVEDFSDIRIESLVFEELADECYLQRRKRRVSAGFEI